LGCRKEKIGWASAPLPAQLVIESPREGDRELFARQDAACLRQLLAEV